MTFRRDVQPAVGPADAPAPGSGALYPGLVERVPAILYTSSRGGDGVWHYVSPQIEAILGWTAPEWCADPSLWRRSLHPEDRAAVLANEGEAEPGADDHDASEYRLRHRDGHYLWIRDDAVLLRTADGESYWHGVLCDITDARNAANALQLSGAQHAAVAALGARALAGTAADVLADEAVQAAIELLGLDVAIFSELVDDGAAFRVVASRGVATGNLVPRLSSGAEHQPGWALTHGHVVVEDWAREDRFARTPAMTASGVQSGMCAVVEGTRGAIGVLGLHARCPRPYTRHELDVVQALANVLAGAYERERTDREIRHRALHDPLTGLPNRTLFMDRLGQALVRLPRRSGGLAVVFLDVDRFKLVNESLGHEVGDELLGEIAARLSETLRATDTVARFAGDEFGILLEDIAGEQDAVEMAQRLAAAFARPLPISGAEQFATVSIGIALAQRTEPAEDLVRDAGAAVHRAKERGGARYELFDETLRARATGRLRTENALRRALERDELTVDYQPIVALGDHGIRAVEALVRWNHPERGRIAPMEFIPVAEESRLIEPIGRWVMEQACRQAASWCTARPDAAPVSVAVNLSAVQFENPRLPDTVAEVLQDARLDPELLALEITESVMMGRSEDLAPMLGALGRLGVRLVLDDFGTGYSSLAYLSRLPLAALKVDRSFVSGLAREPRDVAITEAIVAMSHALSLEVVGEGAETAEQVGQLERMGCNLIQGFHFSRPCPAHEIERMLFEGAPWRADDPAPAPPRV